MNFGSLNFEYSKISTKSTQMFDEVELNVDSETNNDLQTKLEQSIFSSISFLETLEKKENTEGPEWRNHKYYKNNFLFEDNFNDGLFQYHDFSFLLSSDSPNGFEFVFKIPSHTVLSNSPVFQLSFRIVKHGRFKPSNILLKFSSDDFEISDKVIPLDLTENSITLRTCSKKPLFNIHVKIYVDNIVVSKYVLDLWERVLWV